VNWEAIGAVGEVVGAVAVVATLLYVSRQLHEQSRALSTTVRDSVFHQLQEWNYTMISERPLCDLFQRGAVSEDWSEFDSADQARLVHIFYSFFKVFENIFLHASDGSVPVEVWEQNCSAFFAYAEQPGCRRYWVNRQALFDPRFLALLSDAGRARVEPASSYFRSEGL